MIKIDTRINLHKIMRISINKTITKYYLKIQYNQLISHNVQFAQTGDTQNVAVNDKYILIYIILEFLYA